ncbi:MAG: hypothetical protein U5N86_04575 [Planctomycetota bacterium]|nr:hypothetical protein [Planctomycetota bacterium]
MNALIFAEDSMNLLARLAVLLLAVCAIGLGAACSSSSSGTVRSVNGEVSGEWRLVVDDNGHLTYVWVAFKANTITVDSTGAMYDSAGKYSGYLGYDMALLPAGGEWVSCEVTVISPDQLVLTGEGATITATRLAPAARE